MTLEQLFASVLCAAAERAYHKERQRQSMARFGINGPARALILAGKVAAYYDLFPERTDDDDV